LGRKGVQSDTTRVNERWREREGGEVRYMEQMHGREGEEHTHACVHLALTLTYTHITIKHIAYSWIIARSIPLPYEDWQ
jgi:hypothetical protein